MNSPSDLLKQAVTLQRRGKHGEALKRLELYSRLRPTDAKGWRLLAMGAVQAGKTRQGLKAESRAIELQASDPQLFSLAGNIRQSLGDFGGAIRELETATRLDPSLAPAHYKLGILSHALGRSDAAVAAFRAAIDAWPGHIDAWNGLGSVMMNLERIREGAECFEKALSLNPEHVYSLVNYGRYQSISGMFKEAEVSLT